MIILAIILARAGSKRLKNKNKLVLGNKPLVNWSIDFATSIKFISDIVLSTDDKKIIDENKNKKNIKIFLRPNYLRGDRVKVISVILNIIKKYEKNFFKIDAIILLQPTSPFRSKKTINYAFKKFKLHRMKKSIVSVSKPKRFEKKFFTIKDNLLLIIKKNSVKKKYEMNGNFYFASKTFLKKNRSFYFKNSTIPVILKSKKYMLDIDTKNDYLNAKKYLKNFK